MNGQEDIFYRAMLARDYRFDGKFFIGVKTTGIYCRPICPAKPKRKNVEFFKNALSAEMAGYRPCLRCRPESAPLSPAWNGKSSVVQRALKLISTCQYSEMNEETFAMQMGVSARHLRRLFEEEIGKTPKQIMDNNRLDFSRKLISETNIPITEIAFTSGFSSIRRFNDAIKKRFHRSPREIRRNDSMLESNSTIQLSLSYRQPFDWASLIKFYHSHAVFGLESVTGASYERIFKMEKTIAILRLKDDPEKSQLSIEISMNQTRNLLKIIQTVRHMFDLDSDPFVVENIFSECSLMKKLVAKHPGLRLPRGWDPFETAICSILGQLVSTEQARNLTRQLITGYGEIIKHPETGEDMNLFPEPSVLARETLNKIGTTKARKETIQAFSRLVLQKKIRLESVQDPISFKQSLLKIRGIGPWTAEYISLRAMGDTNAFPGTDLILKRALEQNPKLKLESFEPWRAYAAMYLWKEYAGKLSKKKVKAHETLRKEN